MKFNLEDYPLVKDMRFSDISKSGAVVLFDEGSEVRERKYSPDELALVAYIGERSREGGFVSVRSLMRDLEFTVDFNRDRVVTYLTTLANDGVVSSISKPFAVAPKSLLYAGPNYSSARYRSI